MSFNLLADLKQLLREEASGLWPEVSELDFDLEEPIVHAHGDLSINLALVLAKQLKQKPMGILGFFLLMNPQLGSGLLTFKRNLRSKTKRRGIHFDSMTLDTP